jgi:hypothetical protein
MPRVDDLDAAEINAKFEGGSLDLLAVAHQQDMCHFIGCRPLGGSQDARVFTLAKHDTLAHLFGPVLDAL